ncbi:hypothetical protein H5410_050229 [Solanum commersonii]|uniref:DUF7746 domain-containing protein n=1 Tax=Solanum commersonii TaxID=4109 RepID=A0A9J5WUY6_SOLCO|nr:hypothetical protein H5410_050229 [Solanum commersonii]
MDLGETSTKSMRLEEVDNIRLLNERDINLYKTQYSYLHIGMVQIAFKPLTLKGLPKTFLATLCDARNLNFRQSLMGLIESMPNLQLSLTDANILDALTLNVKTYGYNYAPGSKLISLSYRIYFKLLSTLNPRCTLYDISNQTIFVETNFARSKITIKRPIKWEEIDFPISWTLNSVISPNQLTDAVTNSDFSNISQNPNGRICIQFTDNSYAPHRQSLSNNKLLSSVNHSFSKKSLSSRRLMPAIHHISPVEPIYGPARDPATSLHTIVSDGNSIVEKVKIDPRTNIVQVNDDVSDKDIPSHISSLDKKLDDLTILIKDIKADIAKTNFASTSERKPEAIYTHVQRPPEIQDFKFDFADKMDATGDFKNQVSLEFNKLRGGGSKIYEWNLDGLTDRQLTILVHRMLMYATICWWDNYISTKEEAFVINVVSTDEGVDNLGMVLVRNKEDVVYTLVLTILEHFNGRFTNQHETVHTFLNGLRCQTLGQFRWYKDTFPSKVMELPENKFEHWKTNFVDGLPPLFAERVRKALRGSHGEIPYKDYTYEKLIGTCTQEAAIRINITSPLKPKVRTEKGDPDEGLRKSAKLGKVLANLIDLPKIDQEEIFLKLNATSVDTLVISLQTARSDDDYESGSDSDIELLDLSDNDNNGDNPYTTCQEVDDHLIKRNTLPEKDSSFDDLKFEVENLKREIKSLKQNQLICDHRITQIETHNSTDRFSKNKGILEKKNYFEKEPVNLDPKQDMFLGIIQIVTAHKCDADVSYIQKGLVPTEYFQKTTHLVKSASGHTLDIKYKLPNAKICQNKVCIPHFFFLVKNQLYPPIILGTPFINAIYPFTSIDSKGFSATYKDNEITYSFITDPVTMDINALINMKHNHMDSLQMELFNMNILDSPSNMSYGVIVNNSCLRNLIIVIDSFTNGIQKLLTN